MSHFIDIYSDTFANKYIKKRYLRSFTSIWNVIISKLVRPVASQGATKLHTISNSTMCKSNVRGRCGRRRTQRTHRIAPLKYRTMFVGESRAFLNCVISSFNNLSPRISLTKGFHVLVKVLGLVHLVLLSFPHGHGC